MLRKGMVKKKKNICLLEMHKNNFFIKLLMNLLKTVIDPCNQRILDQLSFGLGLSIFALIVVRHHQLK